MSNTSFKTGLAIQLFEARNILLENKQLYLKSFGTCMYPVIKPGDVLRVDPKVIEQISIGDIVVFRLDSSLFAHRAVHKGSDNTSNYIVTRSDNSDSGTDAIIYNDDILGIVSMVERRGKNIKIHEKINRSSYKFFWNTLLSWHNFKHKIYQKIFFFVLFLQQFQIYTRISRLIFPHFQKSFDFVVSVPLDVKGTGRFYRKYSFRETAVLKKKFKARQINHWMITSTHNSKSIATLSFIVHPLNSSFTLWWISGFKIKTKYRGSGVENLLFEKADKIFGYLNAFSIYVSFSERKFLNKKIFRNLSFREIPHFSKKKYVNGSSDQIIMERKVNRTQ